MGKNIKKRFISRERRFYIIYLYIFIRVPILKYLIYLSCFPSFIYILHINSWSEVLASVHACTDSPRQSGSLHIGPCWAGGELLVFINKLMRCNLLHCRIVSRCGRGSVKPVTALVWGMAKHMRNVMPNQGRVACWPLRWQGIKIHYLVSYLLSIMAA